MAFNQRTAFLGLGFLWLVSGVSRGEIYTARVPHLGSADHGCSEGIAKFTENFAKLPQVSEILSTACERDEFDSNKIDALVSYVADKQVVLNFFPDAVSIMDENLGFYLSTEACVADQPRKLKIFEEQTGLQSLATYCFLHRRRGLSRYAMIIASTVQGNGAPQKRNYVRTTNLDYNLSESSQTLADRLAPRMSQGGRILTDISVYANVVGEMLRFSFYSARPEWLLEEAVGEFTSVPKCQEEAAFLDGVLTERFRESIVGTACSGRSFDPRGNLLVYGFSGSAALIDTFSMGRFAINYPSREACLADRESLSNRLAAYGWQNATPICQDSPSPEAVHVIYKKNQR